MGLEKEKEKENKNDDKGFLSIFIASFTTIFIAELGDKTQLATLMLSAESGRPLIVFIGSSFALICSSIVGVLIGKWLSSKISTEKKHLREKYWLNSEALLSHFSKENIPDNKKSIALSVTIQSSEKTLNDRDLEKIHNSIIVAVENKTGAKIRS